MRAQNIQFIDLLEVADLEKFLKICRDLFGLVINFWNPLKVGELLYERQITGYPSFCRLMASSSKGQAACMKCDIAAITNVRETKKPHIYKCHAGLMEVAVPIVIKGEVCAVLLTGQVLTEPVTPEKLQFIDELARKVGLPRERIRNAFCENYVLDKTKLEEIVEIISLFCNHLGDLGYRLHLTRREEEVDIVGRIRYIVTQNYMDENLGLRTVAKQVYRSPSYVSRLFHRQAGTTFTAYLNEVRLAEARKLLSTSSMRISEICFEVGFRSLSHFTRLFKKVEGFSPKTYRLKGSVSTPILNQRNPTS